jgi:enoyl-CoA hydratase/carnithine racemase
MPEILVERPEADVALVRLNRPERRNALSLALRQELADAITTLDADPAVRCIVITGDDKAFAAGADLTELVDFTPNDPAMARLRVAWEALAACPKPIIAAVKGFALGAGCEMAMLCDIVIAGEGAQFGQPEIRVGIMPGAGGTQRLVRAVGKARAMKWLLSAEMISAAEALASGLVSEVVPDAEVLERSLSLARKIARMAPLAAAAIKATVIAGADLPLDQALLLERRAFQLLFATADQKEGMQAFIDGRKPQFTGA